MRLLVSFPSISMHSGNMKIRRDSNISFSSNKDKGFLSTRM